MTTRYKIFRFLPLVAGFLPFSASAQTLTTIINKIEEVAGEAITALSVIAIAIFIYGIVKYIASSGNPEKEKAARRLILAGLIGLFVLVAFWALIWVLTETFDLREEDAPLHPAITSPF